METQKISLHQIRSVPEVLNAAFGFIRQNMSILLSGLLRYVLPSLVVANFILSLYSPGGLAEMAAIFSDRGSYYSESALGSDGTALLLILVAAILSLVASVFLFGFVFGLVRVYAEGSDEFDLRDVWGETKGLFWKIVGTFIGLLIIGIGAVMAYSLIVTVMGLAVPVLSVLFAFAFLLLIPILFTTYALYFPVRFIEERGLLRSFGRAAGLIRESWWRTFGLILLCMLILVILSFGELLPATILELVAADALGDPTSFTSIAGAFVTSLVTSILQLVSIFPMFALIFHYYSQVERNESVALIQDVERIGMQKGEA